MYLKKQYLLIPLLTLFLVACNSSSEDENIDEPLPELSNPSWLSEAHIQMDFVEQSYDLEWNAFGYDSSMEAAASFSFEYGHTPTHDALIPVQWNLSWTSGVDGAGYPRPYVLYKVEGLNPGESYAFVSMVEVESNRSLESYDGGMGPAFAMGAFSSEPIRVEEEGTGYYVLQVDGETVVRSADTVTLGDVDIPEEFLHGDYVVKRIVNDPDSMPAIANEEGEVWILLAIYSGHVGDNLVHVRRIAIDW